VPIFFQHQINETTRLGIWKIEEAEEFFLSNVPLQKEVTHPHKRLQHLAGRFLLQFLFPDFPYELIRIADTRKPYLPDEQYHFSISHCGDFAAAIVSKTQRVGIDIEIPSEKVERIMNKFLNENEILKFDPDSDRNPKADPGASRQNPKKSEAIPITHNPQLVTLLWCSKECIFKWYGDGKVDFRRHIQLKTMHEGDETIYCFFEKANQHLTIHYRSLGQLVMAWVVS
jgi:phosphopantetheinyl transferase